MGLQNMVNVMFTKQDDDSITTVQRGVVALLLQDQTKAVGEYIITSKRDIEEVFKDKNLSEQNKKYIEMALRSWPTKILVIVTLLGETVTWDPKKNDAFKRLECLEFDYLALPEISSSDAIKVAEWVELVNEDAVHKIKAVLPNIAADNEHIINFAHEKVTFEGEVYTTTQFTPYVAGFIASTDPKRSITYAIARGVDDASKLSKKEADDKTAKGELVLFHDGHNVRFASGVNSRTTIEENEDESYKQIKIIEIMDMFHNAVKKAILEKYIGKYSNSYQNKLHLVAEIYRLLREFEREGLLEPNDSEVRLDLEAQRAYLYSINFKSRDGRKVDELTNDEILRANTREKVFIIAYMKPLGAIESVNIVVQS